MYESGFWVFQLKVSNLMLSEFVTPHVGIPGLGLWIRPRGLMKSDILSTLGQHV